MFVLIASAIVTFPTMFFWTALRAFVRIKNSGAVHREGSSQRVGCYSTLFPFIALAVLAGKLGNPLKPTAAPPRTCSGATERTPRPGLRLPCSRLTLPAWHT
ncbi:hypothetical protein LMH87_011184 [Akanthomyces muscarius]|uniref:Uncharacterized protein n=1 Tax=Akanthomyces muscarius TaxID=2231603 RepID=A0A9W8Q8N2_AKAMU|nr:hypothetical protein LMH87_011184 [Akanthomyces muscarius]KAJ4150434.1 hypothetical protein LMH87_011184 [Akanthomyces muscarius]